MGGLRSCGGWIPFSSHSLVSLLTYLYSSQTRCRLLSPNGEPCHQQWFYNGQGREYRRTWEDLETKVSRITGVHEAHLVKTRTSSIILYRIARPVDIRAEDTELGVVEFFSA